MSNLLAAEKQKKSVKTQWLRALQKAIEEDSWGHRLEAAEEYEKLAKSIEQTMADLRLNSDEKVLVAKIRQAIVERAEALEDVDKGLKLEDVKKLVAVLEALFEKPIGSFPVNLSTPVSPTGESKRKDSNTVALTDDGKTDDKVDVKSDGGSLLPPPSKVAAGSTTFSITIEKIGLKDAQTYIQPHITVSVADSKGTVIEKQDTPQTNKSKPNYVMFGTTVHIQTPLEEFQKGCSVFFEFKHYKPKKKKISTRCFAFMEYDEILKAKTGGAPLSLETYQKPTDFTKKKLNLFTIKQLYVHCQLAFVKH